ncbi:Hypothetical predicted protein [Mytilus galloprovincialis]|uniref:Endonuclease/exonuclease/phosphatase domain-containing protein n=1 Tax=Mytilus galloprovincialis TaxID=29158 RepID=A0A8B6CRX5_MYTGA|nr:Hypothetical predicted protein [Mytilus galloprovincialis]
MKFSSRSSVRCRTVNGDECSTDNTGTIEGHNTSDHYPVSAEFSVRLQTAQKQLNGDIVTKINWEIVDKTSYEQILKEELKDRKYLNMRTPYGIEQATNQLISGLTNALNLSYPRRKSKFSRKKKISWSPQLAKSGSRTPLELKKKKHQLQNEINNVFKDHFEKLAKTNSNPNFNIGHDNLVKLDMETIVNICENQEITIQPVTSTEITKAYFNIKKKKGWGCRRFNCRTSNLWWNRVD